MVTHRVTIKGLEVQVVVSDADMTRVGHQRGHHLSLTLHMWGLRHTLKAACAHKKAAVNYNLLNACSCCMVFKTCNKCLAIEQRF